MEPLTLLLLVLMTSGVGWLLLRGDRRYLLPFLYADRASQSKWLARGVVAVAALWFLCAILPGLPPIPLLAPDSGSYLTFAPVVTIGYPAFLQLIISTTGSAHAVPTIQFVLFAASCCTLYAGLEKLFVRPLLAAATIILLFGAMRAWIYNLALLTEGPFASLLLFHLAATAFAIHQLTSRNAILIGATAAAAILVRPAAYFLLGGIGLLSVFWLRQHARQVARIAITAVAVLAAGHLGNFAVRNAPADMPTGMALFPHIAHLWQPEASLVPADVSQSIKTALQPFADKRTRIASLEDEGIFSNQNFGAIQRALLFELGALWRKQDPALDRFAIERRANALFHQLVLETIANDPHGVGRMVLANIYLAYGSFVLPTYSVWDQIDGAGVKGLFQLLHPTATYIGERRLGNIRTPANVDDVLSASLLAHPPRYLDMLSRLPPSRAFLLAMTGASAFIVLFASAFRRYRTGAALLGAYAATLHFGGVLFVALTTVFIPRYAYPLDVLLLVTLGCAADVVIVFGLIALGKLRHRFRPNQAQLT